MLVQELAAIANNFEYAAQGCFEGEVSSRSDFGLDLRPVFHLPQIETEEKKQHTGNGPFREEQGSNRFLGGSDPTLSGFSAAQRLWRRGSLPPKLSSRSSRSGDGRVVGETVRKSESLQPEENNTWHSQSRTQARKENDLSTSRRGSAHHASALCGLPRRRETRVHHWRIVEPSIQ
jgi:hypothetical protein